MMFPRAGERVRPVPARLFRDREQEKTPVAHSVDLALDDAELGRVDLVVRAVDREERRDDLAEARLRIVIA